MFRLVSDNLNKSGVPSMKTDVKLMTKFESKSQLYVLPSAPLKLQYVGLL